MDTTPAAAVTVPNNNSGTDTSVIITVAACVGGLFLIVIIIFIAFVIYFYKKQINEEEYEKKRPSLRVDRLDWKAHTLGQQFGDIDDIDEILWREGGRDINAETSNPAFNKDFEQLDVNNLRAFDSTTDDATSTPETESTSDMVEIKMGDEVGPDGDDEDEEERKKQISILDMKTWGQPGSSRRNSIQSSYGFTSPYSHQPPSPNGISNGRDALRSQDSTDFPFSVSQPSNDPRFQYTRTNPLMAEAMGRSAQGSNTLPFSSRDSADYGYQRDFGGSEDIESVEFDRSSTLRGSRRNQSVIDFYESGTRTTGSSFNLSLESSGSVRKKLLWQNKNFAGLGQSTHTT